MHKRLLNPLVITVLLLYALSSLSNNIVTPLLPNQIKDKSYNSRLSSLFYICYAVSGLIAAPISGKVLSMGSIKPLRLMLFACFSTSLAHIGYMLLSTTKQYEMFVVFGCLGRLLEGIGFFSMKVSVYTYANAMLNDDSVLLRQYLSTLSLASNFMEAFSFALSSGLYSLVGYGITYVIMASVNLGFIFVLLLVMSLAPKEKMDDSDEDESYASPKVSKTVQDLETTSKHISI